MIMRKILFLKEDDVQNDTERDEEEGKTQNLNFSNLTVAFVYCKHFQQDPSFLRV